jgi:hypothetical protein
VKDFSFQQLKDLIERIVEIVWEPAQARAGLALVVFACTLLASKPSHLWTVIGCLAGIGGIALFVLPHISKWRSQPSYLIAVRHLSFDGNVRPLNRHDLPRALRGAEIVPVDLNQSFVFQHGILQDPKSALAQQGDFKSQIAGLARAHAGAAVAYCGKAHIPLAFTAAHLAFSEVPMIYCELDRTTGGWRVLRSEVHR